MATGGGGAGRLMPEVMLFPEDVGDNGGGARAGLAMGGRELEDPYAGNDGSVAGAACWA
jgi:hypothetical protein